MRHKGPSEVISEGLFGLHGNEWERAASQRPAWERWANLLISAPLTHGRRRHAPVDIGAP
jgi:hypothetical protein